ncbi:ABC transporter ATP-binding protein [Carnobacterium gallinarum]|uniref:ABC transporter ATP-binding protein n=1 Tax=Carnobacterium gallinarum TaxID=2749 RepID=UPI00054FA929|nr:ABC transporter ATP-binding protein [Carnobacterium gallinarum]
MGKTIALKNLSKQYGENPILHEINLTIEAGERIVLLGPSGSGKSTLLRMIAGLEDITSGDLQLDGKKANHLESGARDIAMVFQNYALYPHMTVAENIVFALKANKVPKKEIQHRLEESLEMLGLVPFKNRLPKDLSGGQRQRTALARAVVKRTDYFLLDEPLSNLDVRLRLDARKELVKIHEKYQQTFVYVTHDQIEAMTLAHRIVLLNEGHIQMVDTPENVYNRPNNAFTAAFIGSPGMNLLRGAYENGGIKVANQRVILSEKWQLFLQQQSSTNEVLLGIRPEHLQVSVSQGDLKGEIKYSELLGQNYALTVLVDSLEVTVLSETSKWKIGDNVYLQIKQEKLHFFSTETQLNIGYPAQLEEGETINEISTPFGHPYYE